MITCQCGGRIVPSNDFTYYRCKNSACAMYYTVPEILNMSRFDYDGEDEEAIKMLNADGSETYIKVSGVNSGVQTLPFHSKTLFASAFLIFPRRVSQKLIVGSFDSPVFSDGLTNVTVVFSARN